MQSPVGELTIFANREAVIGISFKEPETMQRMLRYISSYYGEPVMAENPVRESAKKEIC
ncbi:hypothetical protein SDC9_68195 [bioreactor metagenome]|uniref:Uncharacterized protein n=1 Tax=bioreactor metagenome TaxID=1076179 RepID=A0A644XZT8_9ZZZZ